MNIKKLVVVTAMTAAAIIFVSCSNAVTEEEPIETTSAQPSATLPAVTETTETEATLPAVTTPATTVATSAATAAPANAAISKDIERCSEAYYAQLSKFSLGTGSPILAETADAGEDYVKNTAFIGDSTSLCLKKIKYLPTENVLAYADKSIYSVAREKIAKDSAGNSISVVDALTAVNPKRVVIMVGTNSSWMKDSAYKSDFSFLIDSIREKLPNIDIIINTVPPMTKHGELEYKKSSLSNQRINEMNVLLVEVAKEKNCYFLNSAAYLKDTNGCLKDDCCNEPNNAGIHLSQKGAETIINAVRTHAISL